MARPSTALVISASHIERRIFTVRGQRVLLDSDLAEAYGISTKRFNQQVTRNRGRFPADFAFRLTRQEFMTLTSQIVTSNGRGGRRYLPWVFTEQGVAMLSSVIQSPTAIKVNIEIMRAFVRMRHLFSTPGELVAQITQLAKTVELHDDHIKKIMDVLGKMLQSPEPGPKGRFGFSQS